MHTYPTAKFSTSDSFRVRGGVLKRKPRASTLQTNLKPFRTSSMADRQYKAHERLWNWHALQVVFATCTFSVTRVCMIPSFSIEAGTLVHGFVFVLFSVTKSKFWWQVRIWFQIDRVVGNARQRTNIASHLQIRNLRKDLCQKGFMSKTQYLWAS